MPYLIVQAGDSPASCCAARPQRRFCANRWRRPLLLQPTPPEQPAPERPAPEQPAPDQPLHPPVSAGGGQAASAAADVKLPSGLSTAALSAAKPAGKQNSAQMKAAYSRLLGQFLAVVSALKRLPPVSHDVIHHIVTQGPPSLPNSGSWMAKSWRRRRLNLSS